MKLRRKLRPWLDRELTRVAPLLAGSGVAQPQEVLCEVQVTWDREAHERFRSSKASWAFGPPVQEPAPPSVMQESGGRCFSGGRVAPASTCPEKRPWAERPRGLGRLANLSLLRKIIAATRACSTRYFRGAKGDNGPTAAHYSAVPVRGPGYPFERRLGWNC